MGSVFLSGYIFLNESPFWGKSSCWVSDLSFELLVLLLGFRLPVGGHFLNESPFWGESSCWVSDVSIQVLALLFGFGLPVGGHFS